MAFSVSAWLTLASITKLSSPGTLGEFALAVAVVVPIFTLSLLHLSTLQATDVQRKYAFADYLALRIWSTVAACVLAGGLAWHYWPDHERSLAIVAVSAGLAARNLSDVCYGAFRRKERLDLVGRSMVLRAVGGLAALTVVLYATRDLIAALVANAAAAWIVATVVDLPGVRALLQDEGPMRGSSPARPRWSTWRSLSIAIIALPVGLVMMLSDLHVTVPRLIIESLVGTRGLGIFVAVAAVAGLGGTLARAGSQAVEPRLASLYRQGDFEAMRTLLGRLLRMALLLGVVGVGVALAVGEPILRLVYGEEHARYGGLLVLFAIGSGVTYVLSLHAGSLTAIRRFKEQAVLRSIQLMVLIAVCAPLTSRYGLMGTAWALLLSESLSLVLHRQTWLWYLHRAREARPKPE